MTYRLVVGERGNEQGHIEQLNAANIKQAKRELTVALREYKGDGWGRVERDVWGNGAWYTIAAK
jgi:hypothetical protein